MKVRLTEKQLKRLVAESVRRIMEDTMDDIPDLNINDHDEDQKKDEIDAAWAEFDRKHRPDYWNDNFYRNPNIEDDIVPGWESLAAQMDYSHTNASNIGDIIRNDTRNYAQSAVGDARPENKTGYGHSHSYNKEWDAALDDTHFDDGYPGINIFGIPTTRDRDLPDYQTSLLESIVRKSVRKQIAKLKR